ncbi:MAG: hypothetical protein UT30_C0007G0007 [Candidatus Uhrbacteria bacterium GW2011_GWF2_39_13]|uniref:Glycosyltransferase RgtA/B/C/D-like domain-containing protein n=1 Tax=Candidatus Uhrbacteria bacterium GW2011_GWF2_39_13 TaxID=1618995 RepID=A0A0G0MVH9_9BACT|nr:MAG: hypothetical protein UT30_C0007G0007 [Candidatus Uhrbacteria bacterium GW2011_GWF2_39_13]HAU65727.1 hypothetical protein [Candidatus Uhrbacteria bacterium]
MVFNKTEVSIDRWRKIALITITCVFFLGSLILVNCSFLFVSPDETANAYFAELFAQSASFQGPYNELADEFDRIHPRSTVNNHGQLLPGSFLGLSFLYGIISIVFGKWVFWILTPLVTIGTAYAWRKLIAQWTNEQIGAITFILFLIHPAVWYYTARGMMHNVLFLDLFILGCWMWMVRPIARKMGDLNMTSVSLDDFFAGLLFGLALFVRSSEVLWIAVLLCLSILIWWRSLVWRRLLVGLCGLFLGLGFFFVMNTLSYGHPLTTGYTFQVFSPQVLSQQQFFDMETLADTVTVLPFGFHPKVAWQHFSSYVVEMFWWLSVLVLPGFFILWSQKTGRWTLRWALILSLLVSVWLVLMYGSWEIHDNPDSTQTTMANSYVRYWLPLYVFLTPIMAATIYWVSQRGRSLFSKRLITISFILLILGFNVRTVFLQGQDGLLKMRSQLQHSESIQASVLRYTSPGSVIIVDRSDKLFFPHRQVWYPLRDEATYAAMPRLVEKTQLYYYGITFPQADIEYLNTDRLKNLGLQIELIETFQQESLYRISSF